MRGMGLVEEKRADEHQQDDANYRINYRRLAQTPVVRPHQSKHSQEPDKEPSSLANDKDVGVAVLLLRGDCGGAENYQGAKQAQPQPQSTENAVNFPSSRPVHSPSCRT